MMEEARPATELLYYLLSRVGRAVERAAENVALQRGLSEPQLRVGLVLAEGHPISNAQLARRTFVSSQASHELTSDLVRRGLVTREAHETNKRVRLLRLTRAGEEIIGACREELIQLEEAATEDMRSGSRDDLMKLLWETAETIKGGYFGDEEAEERAAALKAKLRGR